ncbi:MAG: peptidoglycan recognition family protein [Tepidisphaeraceae bacterium]
MKKSQRKIVVLASLVGVLTLTSALLLALSPPPISGESAINNLWAVDASDATGPGLADAVFTTHVPAREGHWKYIYVHQSNTPSGTAGQLAREHFLIGNGAGFADGQIQIGQRWNNQTAAATPPGVQSIDPDCITICLIGDFDTTVPTTAQIRRVTQLITTLQGQLGIGADKVYLMDDAPGAAGVGRHFPLATIRQQILP